MPLIERFVPETALDAQQKATPHRLVGRQVTEVEGGRSGGGIVANWPDIMRMIDRDEKVFAFTGEQMAAIRGLATQRAGSAPSLGT